MITASGLALILLAGDQLCALPVAHVGETMRPLPVETLIGGPPFAPGVSVIRGQPTPVVDLAGVLGRSAGAPWGRFVTLHVGERTVALAVTAVLGVQDLADAAVQAIPPLLDDGSQVAHTLGTLDASLLLVLQAGRLLPEPHEAGRDI